MNPEGSVWPAPQPRQRYTVWPFLRNAVSSRESPHKRHVTASAIDVPEIALTLTFRHQGDGLTGFLWAFPTKKTLRTNPPLPQMPRQLRSDHEGSCVQTSSAAQCSAPWDFRQLAEFSLLYVTIMPRSLPQNRILATCVASERRNTEMARRPAAGCIWRQGSKEAAQSAS